MQELLFLILGLVGLWAGTEFVIKGAVNIANHYGLSQVFVGIAILAVGTDLPEMVVAINASFKSVIHNIDTSEIIIGNSIGSSLSQISIVMGITGLLGYVSLKKRELFEDGVMLLVSVLLLALLGYDGEITRAEGIVLMLAFAIYYFRLFYQERIGEKIKKRSSTKVRKDILFLFLGMVIVIITSKIVVDNSIRLTEVFEIKQSFVGIVIIGLGTSLPELALSINAMRKKARGLSVGNIIGSNIFDTLIPVGLGATISELKFEKSLIWFDLSYLFMVSCFVLFFLYRKKGIQKNEAIILIGIFVLYVILKMIGL